MPLSPLPPLPTLAIAKQQLEAPSAIPSAGEQGPAFSEVLTNAVNGVAQSQVDANVQVEALARGEGNLHEASLTLEKADISMRLMVKARNKIVEAYQEIMRMPV